MPSDRDAISELAYALWQRRGSPHGSPELDWNEAERQLAGRESLAGQESLHTAPADGKKKRRTSAGAPKARRKG